MTQDSKESALRRWSRRKQETESARTIEPSKLETEVSPDATLPVETEAESKPVLTDADMPAIETLDEDSDFSGFMSAGVSDELRNLALRKLFKAPVFNIRDGLDEYDEDYTYFEKLGDIVTCDMKHEIEMKEQKEREALEAAEAAEAEAEVEAMESIEDEADPDQEAIEQIDGEDAPDEPAEIVADADLEFKQESKNEQ